MMSVHDRDNGELVATSFITTTTNQVEFFDIKNGITKRVSKEHFKDRYVVKLIKERGKKRWN